MGILPHCLYCMFFLPFIPALSSKKAEKSPKEAKIREKKKTRGGFLKNPPRVFFGTLLLSIKMVSQLGTLVNT